VSDSPNTPNTPTASVTVQLPASLATLAAASVVVGADTVAGALSEMRDRFPRLAPRLCDASGQPHPFVALYVNARPVRLAGGLAAPLADGDEIRVVTAIAGG